MSRQSAYNIVKDKFNKYVTDAQAGNTSFMARLFNVVPGKTGIADANTLLAALEESDKTDKSVVLLLTQHAAHFGARKRMLTLECLESIYEGTRGITTGSLTNHVYLPNDPIAGVSMIMLLGRALIGTNEDLQTILTSRSLSLGLESEGSDTVSGLDAAYTEAKRSQFYGMRAGLRK